MYEERESLQSKEEIPQKSYETFTFVFHQIIKPGPNVHQKDKETSIFFLCGPVGVRNSREADILAMREKTKKNRE